MKLSDWRNLLLPEQLDFFVNGRGHALNWEILTEPSLEFEFMLDEGFWVYINGTFYIHEEDTDWMEYAAEQEANGVERVVLLDWYGDVLHETARKYDFVAHQGNAWTIWLENDEMFETLKLLEEVQTALYDMESTPTMLCLSTDDLDILETKHEFLLWVKRELKYRLNITEVRIGKW